MAKKKITEYDSRLVNTKFGKVFVLDYKEGVDELWVNNQYVKSMNNHICSKDKDGNYNVTDEDAISILENELN